MLFGFKAGTHFKIYFNATLLTPFAFMPRPYLKATRAQILIHAKFSATRPNRPPRVSVRIYPPTLLTIFAKFSAPSAHHATNRHALYSHCAHKPTRQILSPTPAMLLATRATPLFKKNPHSQRPKPLHPLISPHAQKPAYPHNSATPLIRPLQNATHRRKTQ